MNQKIKDKIEFEIKEAKKWADANEQRLKSAIRSEEIMLANNRNSYYLGRVSGLEMALQLISEYK